MPDPSILDANAAENWRKLPMQFEIYLVAKGKDDKVGKLNKMLIITLCWARSRRRIQPFVYTDEKRKVAIKLFL